MDGDSSLSTDVTEALAKARYNEIVELQGEDENQKIYLVPCIDETNGGIQWNQLEAGDVLSRYLQTKKWVFPMLNDQHRNQLYRHAIEESVKALVDRFEKHPRHENSDQPPILILDIGCGTGLLAMMATQSFQHLVNNQHPCSVRTICIEMASCMAELARETIRNNRLDEVIEVQEGHSCDLPPLEPRAHYCVSELLDSSLLGEGIIPTLRDAWERHLLPDAVVVPQRARVYAQLVEGTWLSDYYGPHHPIFIDGASVHLGVDNSDTLMLDASCAVFELRTDELLLNGSLGLLTEPVQILAISLARTEIPCPGHIQHSRTQVIASKDGLVSGVLVWWEVDLWEGVTLSNQPRSLSIQPPGKAPFQDHWHQCVHILEKDSLEVKRGESCTLLASHDDYRITVRIDRSVSEDVSAKRPRTETAYHNNSLISTYRACQLNDSKRQNAWGDAIKAALAIKGMDACFVDVSDFGLGACFAAALGARNVTSIESSSTSLPLLAAQVAQLGNGFPKEGAKFEILRCHPEQLTSELMGGSLVDVIVSDYYLALEGWHLQESINFYYIVHSLRSRKVLSPDVFVIPSKIRVMGCAVESEQLRLAYSACGGASTQQSICGFDHSFVNNVGDKFHQYDMSIPIWQFEHEILSNPMVLLDLSSEGHESCQPITCSDEQFPFLRAGICDALLVWLEYDVGSCVLSSNGRPYNQIVRMVKPSHTVKDGDMLQCKPLFGGLGRFQTHDFIVTIQSYK